LSESAYFGSVTIPVRCFRTHGDGVPLRRSDLGPGDFVKVESIACGYGELIPPGWLPHGLRLSPHTPVLDLEPRLRCREF